MIGLGGRARSRLGAVARAAAPARPLRLRAGYDEGQALLGQKRYAEAVEKLRPVTVAQPDFAAGWYALALAARRAGNCTEAIPPTAATPPCARPKPSPTSAWACACATPATGRRRWRRSSASWNWSTGPARRSGSRPRRGRSQRSRPPPPPAGGAAAAYEEAQRLRDAGKIEAALKRFADAVALDPDLIVGARRLGRAAAQGSPREGRGRRCSAARSSATRSIRWPGTTWRSRCARPCSTPSAIDAYRHYIALRPNDPDPHYGIGARACTPSGATTRPARSFETYVAMENRASRAALGRERQAGDRGARRAGRARERRGAGGTPRRRRRRPRRRPRPRRGSVRPLRRRRPRPRSRRRCRRCRRNPVVDPAAPDGARAAGAVSAADP